MSGTPSGREPADRSMEQQLAWFDAATEVEPPAGLGDEIMAAISREPRPAPLRAAALAVRTRRLRRALVALFDVWPVAWSGPRPFAIRASALAVVGLIVIAGGTSGGAIAVGAWNLIAPAPSPTVVPVNPEPSPVPSASPIVTPAPTPASMPAPVSTPIPSAVTSGPTSSAVPQGAVHEGDHAGSASQPPSSLGPAPTHHAEMTHMPAESQMPGESHHPEPGDSGHDGGG